MELSAHYAALDTEEPDSEDDASAASALGDDAAADDGDDDDAPLEEPNDEDDVYAVAWQRILPEHDAAHSLHVRRSALGDDADENDYGDIADDDAADDAAADFGVPRESPLDLADAFAIADAVADLEICDERDACAIAVALAGELLSLRILSEDALLSVFSAGASSASMTPVSGGEGEPSLSDRASQALNYVYYSQPDHVLSKLNEWLVDPGVHDASAANRIAQLESLFHMSPEGMDENSAHEQASKKTVWKHYGSR